MRRRSFLASFGFAGSAGLAGRAEGGARAAPQARIAVGGLDLTGLEIIDTHVHPPDPMTLADSYRIWNSSFVDALLPSYDFPEKEGLRARLAKDFEDHLYNLPRQTGYFNYVARVHGVSPDLAGFDSVMARHIGGDFQAYVGSILDREKIGKVVLQSRDSEPRPPEGHLPRERFVWTYAMTDLLQREWAVGQGAKGIDDVLDRLDRIMEISVANACVGFKIAIAYFRPLAIRRVKKEEAAAAFKSVLAREPSGYRSFPGRIPSYDDPDLEQAQRAYQDFLLKHIFVKAGRLDVPMVIHIAVGLHPALQFKFNDPTDLYETFRDEEVERAYTRFVLIHTSYPYHHFLAAMLSQFPNVYTDLSFFSKFPGTLEETLRAFLSLAPPEKVMHGSDSNNVPEEIGYCADNTRRALAKVLNEFRTHYGWTDADCRRIATQVLAGNARRVFRIA
jgi:predicted TIM-barrel fold metal-dependent hydrolase